MILFKYIMITQPMTAKNELKKHQIIIVDDHPIFRSGLLGLLNQEKSVEVIAEASNGKELLELLQKKECHLVMMDVSMPQMDGVACTKEIRRQFPKVKILIITMHDQPVFIRELFSLGVNGYILKSDVQNNILRAVQEITNNRRYVSGDVAGVLFNKNYELATETKTAEALTAKEIEVIKHISNGLTSRQVAQEMNISQRTVETHRYNVHEKLGIKNTAELIKFAIYNNLI